MGLEFAIDELYATGWSAEDQADCSPHADGRSLPSLARVRREFAAAGYSLEVRHVQLFDCHQAEWRDAAGSPIGAVVGRTEAEAYVYALSQFRRHAAAAVA